MNRLLRIYHIVFFTLLFGQGALSSKADRHAVFEFDRSDLLIDSEEEIKLITTFPLPPRSETWSKGYQGDINPAMLQVVFENSLTYGMPASLPGPGSAIKSALNLRSAGDGGGLTARQCKAGSCKGIALRKKGKFMRGHFDGYAIQVRDLGGLCRTKDTCSVLLPSWTIEALRLNGGIRNFPRMVTIIQTTNQILLLNSQTGKIWWQLPKESVSFGNQSLRDALFVNATTLMLQFESGAILVDWQKDQVIRVSRDGLQRLNGGVSYIGQDDWEELHMKKPSKFINVSGEAIWWEDGFWSFKHQQFFKHPFTPNKVIEMIPGELFHRLVYEKDQTLVAGNFQSITRDFKKVFTVSKKVNADESIWSGMNLVYKSKDGVFVVAEKPLTSLSGFPADKVRLFPNGHAFVEDDKDKKCQIVHMRQHPKASQAFSQTGLQSDCGKRHFYSASSDYAAISILTEKAIKVKLLH